MLPSLCNWIRSNCIHYANMSVQYTAIFHGCKNDNFQMKIFDFFLIFAQNIDCGYTLEPPQTDCKRWVRSKYWDCFGMILFQLQSWKYTCTCTCWSCDPDTPYIFFYFPGPWMLQMEFGFDLQNGVGPLRSAELLEIRQNCYLNF